MAAYADDSHLEPLNAYKPVGPLAQPGHNGGPPMEERVIDHIRRRCEDDFKFFVRYFFKHRKSVKFQWGEHHHRICEALMRVWNGVVQNLIINIPPRYGKTELVVILFTVWCFVKNPRCEFMHLSFSDPLVKRNSDAIRDIIKSPEFVQLWPHLTIRASKDAKRDWELEQGGVFYAAAAGATVTGMGAGLTTETDPETGEWRFCGALLLDDMLKPEDARHDEIRTGMNLRWEETIKHRRNSPRTTPTICIMQRVHQEDFVYALRQDPEFMARCEELVMGAIQDEGLPTERALWPEKHSLSELHNMKNAPTSDARYYFAAQYNQNPTPRGGNVIKTDGFRYYSSALPPRIKYRIIFGDTAQKIKKRNDYSVLQDWGLSDDGRLYLLDQDRGKWEAPMLRRRARAFWNKRVALQGLGAVRVMKVEDKASGTGLIQDLKKAEVIDGIEYPAIPIIGIPRDIDKYQRVSDIVSYIESGYVYLPEDAPWLSEFLAECEAFTANDTHAHDDQIDPMCDAISDMLAKPKGFFG